MRKVMKRKNNTRPSERCGLQRSAATFKSGGYESAMVPVALR